MYEISLVPDVKSELIRKLKIRNLVFLICIIVAASCGAVFIIMFSIIGGQGIKLSAQDVELDCRSEGKGKCESKYGTPVLKFENESELLTIQDQMKNMAYLNQNKIKFSRVFNILDTIRPNYDRGDENEVKISEISADIANNTITFDALGYSLNNIGYRALEAFKKSAQRSYFDYGSYMRLDSESGEYVAIPSFCIKEETDNDGVIYGVYKKGTPGCEAPMVEKDDTEDAESTNESGDLESNTGVAIEGEETTEQKAEEVKQENIRIRRTYNDESDLKAYKNGNDRFAKEGTETRKGYYFESKCIQYDSDGAFDESATLTECPVLAGEPEISDSAYGRDSDGTMALAFSVSLGITPDVFLSANKHMLIVSPSRQNVTDSYIQIKGMFGAIKDKNVGEEEQ